MVGEANLQHEDLAYLNSCARLRASRHREGCSRRALMHKDLVRLRASRHREAWSRMAGCIDEKGHLDLVEKKLYVGVHLHVHGT